MDNLGLPHPKKIAVAIPGNCRCGRPTDDHLPDTITWAPVRQTYGGLKEIDAQWVAEHLDEVTVVDVREPEEFNDRLGHIANATLMPLGQLQGSLSALPTDQPIVTVCHAGSRSGQATVILQKADFAQVANLRGGMLAWHEAGLPTVRA